MQEITIAKITGWLWSIVPVVSGSFYAYISNNKELDRYKAWSSYLIGTFIAFISSKAVIEYFNIAPLSYISYSIQIISGLFIIQIITEAFKQIPKFVDAIRVKWFGS